MSDPFAPYLSAHESPNGAGDARPTAMRVVQDDELIEKMTDKTMLITGATSGIGIETARALYATGAHIFITARDVKKGEDVVKDIVSSTPSGSGSIEVIEMDLGSLESVRKGTAEFLKKSNKLNVLVNNAGMHIEHSRQ